MVAKMWQLHPAKQYSTDACTFEATRGFRNGGQRQNLTSTPSAAVLTKYIWAYLWGKMGYGAMLFATALTHESMSENFANPERAPVLIALAREVMRVAKAEGVKPCGFNGYDPAAFHADATAEQSKTCINELTEFTAKTAKTHSGIYRDIAIRKRKTEVDPQIGGIIEVRATSDTCAADSTTGRAGSRYRRR